MRSLPSLYFKLSAAILFLSMCLGAVESKAQKGVEDKRNAFNNRRFYARSTRMRDNAVALQIAQLPLSLRGTYERRLNTKFIVGAGASVRFLSRGAGTIKSEVFGKYFTNKRAPQGLYVYAETGGAFVQNYTISKQIESIGKDVELPANGNIVEVGVLKKSVNFFSFFTGTGVGFQNAFGSGRRTLVDVAFGYRWYTLPNRLNNAEADPVTKITYGKIKADFSPISPISPFTFRIGLGYFF